MKRCCQGTQAKQDTGRGAVEPLVCNAEDPALPHSVQMLPAAPLNNALEGHAITCAAPAEDHSVGIGGGDGIRSGLLCRVAKELSAGGLDKLRDPRLRVDERLAPFLAIDDGPQSIAGGASARCCNLLLHFIDQRFCRVNAVHDGADEAD